MALRRWRLIPPASVRTLGLFLCFGAVGCSGPTEPSPARVGVAPDPPQEAFFLEGKWEGTYRIGRAEPSNCGVLIGCDPNPRLTLTLERSGDALSGVLQLGEADDRGRGRFAVRGRVTDGTQVTLFSDPQPVAIPCPARPTAVGQTRLVAWSTQLVGGKSLVGTFNSQEFRLFAIGGTNLCPSGTVSIFGEDVRVTRLP
jgi:hypothetical protein